MQNTRSVLIVEDTSSVREPLAALLALYGYEVVEALDGEDALNKLVSSERPGLILLDLLMPRIDGWTFLEVAENEADFADIPVVVISAVAPLHPPQKCKSLVATVHKPFDFLSLLSLVERYCGQPVEKNFVH